MWKLIALSSPWRLAKRPVRQRLSLVSLSSAPARFSFYVHFTTLHGHNLIYTHRYPSCIVPVVERLQCRHASVLDFDMMGSEDDNSPSGVPLSHLGRSCTYPPGTGTTLPKDEEEWVVRVHIVCNEEPLHGVSVSTSTPASCDPARRILSWDNEALIFFGVKYRDLTLDARLVFTVRDSSPRPVAVVSLSFFGPHGVARMGKQKLLLDMCAPSERGKHAHLIDLQRRDGVSEYTKKYARDDVGFRIEKAREKYAFSQAGFPPVEWLDRLSLPHTARLLANLAQDPRDPREWALEKEEGGEGLDEGGFGQGPCLARGSLHESGFLVVTLPLFRHPVLFQERLYPGVAGLPCGGLSLARPLEGPSSPASSPPLERWAAGPTDAGFQGLTTAKDLNCSPGWELCAIYDCEAESDNPVEGKYRRQAHDQFRGSGGSGVDLSLKPNKEERERIEALLASPSDHLRIEEKDLLWTFRHTLPDKRQALTKFLLSVDWSREEEVLQVPRLLEQWKAKANVELSDALKLLGREKAFQHEIVRAFAVDTLRRASDDELLTYLLQLVQALRYEDRSRLVADMTSSLAPSTSVTSLPEDWESTGGTAGAAVDAMDGSGSRSYPLARFLIGRACTSLELSNFLYWYLRVEIAEDDSGYGDVFKAVFDDFGMALREVNPVVLDLLKKQDEFFTNIARSQRQARDEKGRKDAKEEKLRQLLAEADANGLPKGAPYVPMPLDPHVKVAGVVASTAFMFRSALYPAVIQFRLYNDQSQQPLPQQPLQRSVRDPSSASMPSDPAVASSFVLTPRAQSPSACYKVIFKNGDDLRQDQLIIQMVTLMDFLLKRVNLDLKLTPYRILATGPRDGMIEFVSTSSPISEVLAKHGSIQEYFRVHAPEPGAPFGIRPEVLATFVKSLAGYCVITYLLGIGDRHLDNIMLLPHGHLLHIDFGFIFGQDPKPMPPPFRLAPQMVEGLGGEAHENFMKFKRYCCQAYNCFRGHANLILTLLGLMVDAGIKDLAGDAASVLGKVEERFRLDLSAEQAELFFLSLINESLNAFLPEILERVHKFALMRR